MRGKYVMEVLLGVPPPAPPANVPPLMENVNNQKALSVRERLEQHRKVEPCASCHKMMDPIGMALENFDAIGVWRANDSGFRIDPSAQMYDGTPAERPGESPPGDFEPLGIFCWKFYGELAGIRLGPAIGLPGHACSSLDRP